MSDRAHTLEPSGVSARAESERLHRFERLLEVSVRLNPTLDADALLHYIIETAADVLDCEAASLLLFDAPSGTLRFAAATASDPEQIASIPVPLAGSLAGRIFTRDAPLVVQDVSTRTDHFKGSAGRCGSGRARSSACRCASRTSRRACWRCSTALGPLHRGGRRGAVARGVPRGARR